MYGFFKQDLIKKICKRGVPEALAIICIPVLFGSDAIWIAPFVAETVTLVIAIVLSKTSGFINRIKATPHKDSLTALRGVA